MFDATRSFLKKMGLPSGDRYDLPTSKATFVDGAHFRVEVPTVNSFASACTLLEESEKIGLSVNRISETYGMMRHTSDDIKNYVRLCKDYGCELVMAIGPRATYDTSATAQTPQGSRIAYRLRGQEQLIRAIEDLKRGLELGVKHFIIYDEGMLYVLNQMRAEKEIPADTLFKISAHNGYGNPAAFKLLESLGADSINPVRDLQLPMISALREAIKVPMVIHTDNPPASGGFIRFYEAPEMVRIGAPIYLKSGNSAVSSHGQLTTEDDGRRMARAASIVVEMVKKYYPEAKQSPKINT